MRGITGSLTFAAALMLCASNAAIAAGKLPMFRAHRFDEIHRAIRASPGSVTLHDQNDDANKYAIVSEDFFLGDFFIYDSAGADDFVIPDGHTWHIREVDVTGEYGEGGRGPAGSESILFYKSTMGLPGELVAECDELQGIDNNGSFAIEVPKSCKVVLRGGHRYWVSVIANEKGSNGTVWGWQTRNTRNDRMAAWENPGGGFGICLTWGKLVDCNLGGGGPDFMFALKGKDVFAN